VIVALVTVNAYPGTFDDLPVTELTAPVDAHTTGIPEFAQFQEIVARAEAIRPEGTAIYVVGDQESWWHEQLWGPTVSDAPFFYDDWMWYWHPDRPGPYVYEDGHYFPDPAQTFEPGWLEANGVGVLVVTNMAVPAGATDPRHAAESNPLLEHQQTIGYWDLYLVTDPGPIVTNGDVDPLTLSVGNHRIEATFEDAGGVIEVRRNWYPRWQAFADGEEVDVERTDDGYMRITVPNGTETVELRYGVTGIDWLGRSAAVMGLVLTILVGLGFADRFLGSAYPRPDSPAP